MAVHKLTLGTALLALVAGPAAAMDVAVLKPGLEAEVAADYPHLLALYKDIHAHPELGFQETHTAAKLAGEMRALGLTVTEGVGKTGLVAIYRNGAGPTIMIRTELDALPMEEKTGLAYASHDKAMWNGRETFVDHSCGHDVHMAIWVGTAKALLAMKDKWRGTLMFVAQPSEETVQAAPAAMLADGLFTRFGKPNYAVAIHDLPEAAGTVMWRFGATTTTRDTLDVTFTGPRRPWRHAASDHRPGGHGCTLRRGYSDRHKPRKRPCRLRRGHHRRDGGGKRRQYHSRSCRSAWHGANPGRSRTRQNAGWQFAAPPMGWPRLQARHRPRSKFRWMRMPLWMTRLSPAGPPLFSNRLLVRKPWNGRR